MLNIVKNLYYVILDATEEKVSKFVCLFVFYPTSINKETNQTDFSVSELKKYLVKCYHPLHICTTTITSNIFSVHSLNIISINQNSGFRSAYIFYLKKKILLKMLFLKIPLQIFKHTIHTMLQKIRQSQHFFQSSPDLDLILHVKLRKNNKLPYRIYKPIA